MSLKKKIFVICSVFCLAFLFLSCAHQIGPYGGPSDTTPPEIMTTFPLNSTLRFADSKILLEFSKYMNRRAVEEAVFVSPNLGQLTFDWGAKEVEIRFSDSLRHNTTYIFTLGTDAVDSRSPANHLAHAFALAFSTGDHIDSGSIAGKIFDPKPEGIMVFAYQIDGQNADTLNPSFIKPDYLTQTGKDGLFSLQYLKPGNYRIVAVRDEYKNLLYDPQTDQYGITSSDVSLTSDKSFVSGLQFKMAAEDTTHPFLSSARSLDRNHVLMTFSETMDISTADAHNVSIIDTLSHDSLQVIDFSFIIKSGSTGEQGFNSTEAQLETANQDSSKTYQVFVNNVKDRNGNLITRQLNSGVFTGDGLQDTLKPSFTLLNIPNGKQNVRQDDSLHIVFNKAIRKLPFMAGCSLQDSSARPVKGTFKWWNSSAVSFIPSLPLTLGMQYKLSAVMDSLQDFSGIHATDSTRTVRFRVVDENLLGSIKGTVTEDRTATNGKIILRVAPVSSRGAIQYQQVLVKPGSFTFNHLPEEKYIVSAFIDSDSNGVYSYGKPFPFRHAERFVVYPDTLKVRARWPLEGVTIHF